MKVHFGTRLLLPKIITFRLLFATVLAWYIKGRFRVLSCLLLGFHKGQLHPQFCLATLLFLCTLTREEREIDVAVNFTVYHVAEVRILAAVTYGRLISLLNAAALP